MNELKPTREIACKVLKTVDAGLSKGLGEQKAGKMCIEAAVCFAFGLPHGDNPLCVGSSVRSFKISLNDCDWSSESARAKGMRKLAIAQLGSNEIDQFDFSKRLALKTIQRIVPKALRAAASCKGLPNEHKTKLETEAVKCESAIDLNAARAASYAARAANDASDASDARAASYAARAASDAATKDSFLIEMAEIGLEVLIELKSPGCEWLDLCECNK